MSGGGSGGSGTQKYEWNDVLAPEWADTLSYGRSLRDRPYNPYTGQRIAFMNQDQQDSIANTRTFLNQLNNPHKAVNAAIDQTTNTLNDDYLSGAKANPYAAQANKYGGLDSPYFRDSLNATLEDVTNAYQQGTSADTTRMFNLSGAFGGSAHQKAVANNEAGLARNLSRIANEARQGQYDRSAQLEEGRLGRGSGAFENERGRQLGAIGLGNSQQGLALDRARAQMGIGDIQRAYEQDFLNQNFADWQEGQNYPYRQLDMYTGLLSRAQGGMSPNLSYTTPGYSASPFSQIMGGLLAYNALGR